MQRSWATPFVESFDSAFHGLKDSYQTSPFCYLTKWDIVADLYARMRAIAEIREVETGRFTIGKDGRWRQKKVRTSRISSSPLHIMLGFEIGDKPKSDIGYIDLDSMQFAVTARFGKKRPTSLASWRFGSGAGVTVVYNSEVQYARRKNSQTGRYSKTDGLKEVERDIIREITNLKAWDKSVLLFVDNHGMYTRAELEASFSRKLKPYTMKLYYLTPKSGFFITGKRKEKE
ncbi:MAG: hypothetical protein U9R75_06990 [Candidatus Thermoplasmatota archaeon]|nr:hypothetical protein [Candidatus Thermoplasmatota archaeon]